jgi:hypothetical protein
MDVNKIQITQDGLINKELVIPIQLTWDYLGLDQSIDEYEANIIKEVTGTYGDFEVTRFAHAPIAISDPYSNNDFEITDIQYEFNFFSGGSLSASTSWRNNYISEGFTPQEIYYYTNNFTNSFFKLDLYDNVDEKRQTNYITIIIPTQQGLTMDAIMQRTPVKIKKPYFVLDYVGDKEGFFIYWLKKRNFLNIDTFYMAAKFFNAKTGQFTKMMTGKGINPLDQTNGPQYNLSGNTYAFDNTQYFYYTVKLDYPTQTYQVFNTYGQRLGTGIPIKWYEYVNPPQ